MTQKDWDHLSKNEEVKSFIEAICKRVYDNAIVNKLEDGFCVTDESLLFCVSPLQMTWLKKLGGLV
jgi:SUMO ligase MMS21 Smc5/6 complex component